MRWRLQMFDIWLMNWQSDKTCSITLTGTLTQFDIVPLFATAYNRSATVDSATKGFSITEIWPFDDAVFDAELQAPLQANPSGGQGPANPPTV